VISSPPPLFESLDITESQHLLRTNIEGTFLAIQSVLPLMRERQWGRIVNVSAVLAEDGVAGYACYAAAKSALHGLTRTLSKELGPAGILINCVMPGLTLTDRARELKPAVRDLIARSLPIRRLLTPCEIAGTIVFLSSGMNRCITGEILRVSGGRG
jgi:NAD(P)-dependent dehydrogenase (short-subunit alcohol dehydrogenase family)